MTTEAYIDRVKDNLKNSDEQQAVRNILALEKLRDASPLVDLIHGDSRQLIDDINLRYNDDDELADEAQIKEVSKEIAHEVVGKIRKYLDDWDAGNTYKYSFKLNISFGRFKDAHGGIENIEAYRTDLPLHTVDQAIQAAKEWDSTLLERVVFYPDQAVGHKRGSVDVIYRISDSRGKLISDGNIYRSSELVCTWNNNLYH